MDSTKKMMLSIVIPVCNGGESFRRCLASLADYAPPSIEIVIVVDGGTDHSGQLAQAFGAKVLQLPTSGGPARARNLGAQMATGDILFFMDADVTIAPNTLEQIIAVFQEQPDLAALIGSYDDMPGAPNFLAQYKNLFHHYTHQTASEEASTFWGACGAIRRDIFLKVGGFNEAYRYPSIEDIELGYRLRRLGYRIRLCKSIQVKHLKRWEPVSLLKAEIFYRALPWTELLWHNRQFINDLNLKSEARLSVVLTFTLVAALIAAGWWQLAWGVAAAAAIALLLINLPVYRFFLRKRGWIFMLKTIPWHWLYFFYSGFSFAIGTARYHLFSKRRMRPVNASAAQIS